MKGILYFDSKYGTTEKISRWIASEIKHDIYIKLINKSERAKGYYDFYILGTPVYIGKPTENFLEFIDKNKGVFINKPLFLFINSWAESTVFKNECNNFIELIKFHLEPAVTVMDKSLPGKLIMNKISSRDRGALKRLLRRIDSKSEEFNSEKVDFNDQTDEVTSKKFGCEINEYLKNKSNIF